MIYAVVQLTVHDPDSMANYAKSAGAALAKWGAQPVAVSADLTQIEGQDPLPDRVVILSFPDRDAALGWINDPDFTDVHALRRKAGKSEITLLG